MKKAVKNVAASMRAKLLEHSRQTKEDFQFLLDRWVAERFLFRLGLSARRDGFVLKGATLFLIWNGALHRRTRDVDLLGRGSSAVEDIINSMREVCSVVEEDGILFQTGQITGQEIRSAAEYNGVRVHIPATLDRAKTVLQVDIGFGDLVDPSAEESELPVILPLQAPRLKVYPPEVAIAEKFQAMVGLDLANSRMKDFYDIWFLSRERSFLMSRLARALRGTFDRRGTALPISRPTALTDKFLLDKQKVAQWREFLVNSKLPVDSAGLKEAGDSIASFLMPVLDHLHQSRADDGLIWSAESQWRRADHVDIG